MKLLRLFIIGWGIICFTCSKERYNEKDTLFLAQGLFSKDTSADNFYSKALTVTLKNLKETPSLNDSALWDGEMYRLTVIPSVGGPFMIRVSKIFKDSSLKLVYRKLSGFKNREDIRIDLVHTLDSIEYPQALDSLSILLDNLNFWELDNDWECDGADGDIYVLEGLKNGRYHLICRWSPEVCTLSESQYMIDLIKYLEGLKRVR